MVAALLQLSMPQVCARTLRAVTIELPRQASSEPYLAMVREVYGEIERDSGVAFEIRVAPYARALAMIASGEADVLIALPNIGLERDAVALGPVVATNIVIVGKTGTQYGALTDLHGKTVGVMNGATLDARLWQDARIAKHRVDTQEQSLRMLLLNRLDAIAGPEEFMFFTARLMGYPRHTFGKPLVLGTQPACLYFSRRTFDSSVANKLRTTLSSLQERKTLQRIHDRYLGTENLCSSTMSRQCKH
jgi:ABC-type amino acid transport substrate-binding protein